MKVTHNVQYSEFDKFVKHIEKLRKEKMPFTFNGNNSNNIQDFNVSWTTDEEILTIE